MKLIEFSTRRPVSVFIFAVAAVVFGLVAFNDLATDLLPDITYPSVAVRTTYEGAAPLEVESLISRPVENAVGVVNNVVRVISSSRADVSEVTLEFAWGADMDFAALDVRERLDSVQLPAGAQQPVLLRYDPSLDPILRIGAYGPDDLARLRFLAEEDIEIVDGISSVSYASDPHVTYLAGDAKPLAEGDPLPVAPGPTRALLIYGFPVSTPTFNLVYWKRKLNDKPVPIQNSGWGLPYPKDQE